MKLSKTGKMWMARLRKGPWVLQYRHDAVNRLVGRGLATIETKVVDKGKTVKRVLSLAIEAQPPGKPMRGPGESA